MNKKERQLFKDKVEIPAWTLIEIKRAFKALIKDKNSYLYNVFSDDAVFHAMRKLENIYIDYFEEKW